MASDFIVPVQTNSRQGRGRPRGSRVIAPPPEMSLLEFRQLHADLTIEHTAVITGKSTRTIDDWIHNGSEPASARILLALAHQSYLRGELAL